MLGVFRTDSTKLLHLTIIVLQIFTVAQVVWWFIDQRTQAEKTTNQIMALYSYEMAAAQELIDLGRTTAEVKALFPHAEIANGRVSLAQDAIDAVQDEQRSHVNQYAWEGGFFLFVLAACIVVLWRGLSVEANVRRRQDNFLAMVSHQFKTPLASLKLSLETMLMRDLSSERSEQLSKRMLSDLARMENMVSKILDSARLDRGRVTLNKERLNLSEAVRHVLSNLEEVARREGVKISTQISSDIDVDADPMAVDTVLRNLIENAIAAMGPTQGGEIVLAAARDGDEVTLKVSDNGIGFTPGQGAQLFAKFFRVESHGGRDAAGTGLGLFIVDRFMHFGDGRASAYSDGLGKGATFKVTWPASHAQEL